MAPGSLDYWSNAKEARLLQLGLSAGVATQQLREISDSLYDQEIAALSKVMLSLKTARNARAPIYKLSDDILLEIFMVVEMDSTPMHGPTGYNSRGGSLPRAFSQVCLRWRALALSSKSFWAIIDLAMRPQWILELLRRADTMPLSVRAVDSTDYRGLSTGSFADAVATIGPHCERIASLELCTTSAQAPRLMQHIPSCETFTALKKLVIQHPRGSTNGNDGHSVTYVEAGPESLSRIVTWLSGSLPQLREVSLCGSVAFSASSTVFENVLPIHLTSLCVNQDAGKISDHYDNESFSKLLSFLRRSTGLKTLVLRNVLPTRLARDLAGTEPIPLLQLERLELADEANPCSCMLNTIHYPVKCSVAVEAEGGEATQYSILWPHVVASANGRTSSLRLEQEERTKPGGNVDPSSCVQFTFLPPSHARQNSEGVGSHQWRFRSRGSPTKLISTLLSLIPLIDTQRLTIKGPVQLSAPDWHASLSKPSSIQTLAIHSVRSGGYNLCVALGFSTAELSAPQTHPGILLPSLSRWELHDCDLELPFRVDAPEHGVSMAVGEYRPLRWFILRTMRARVEAGAVPRQLVLTNCSRVTDSWVEEMKAAVPEEMREWDFDAWMGQAQED